MFTHLIQEDAFNQLSRAHEAARTLACLLTVVSESDDGLIASSQVAHFIEYIARDLGDALSGCEETTSGARVSPLNLVRS